MTVLRKGDPAPDLDLVNQSGQPVSLVSFRGQGVIVYFFPEAFSPGCTEEVCDIRDNVGALTAAGFVVLGVSGDSPERLAEFAAANAVNHDLLSDPGCLAARRWGAYGQKMLGGVLTDAPIRSTFVVGADGLLQSAQYHVNPRGHAAALIGSIGPARIEGHEPVVDHDHGQASRAQDGDPLSEIDLPSEQHRHPDPPRS